MSLVAGLASLLSPLSPGVVVMTTCGTTDDGRVVELAAFCLGWNIRRILGEIADTHYNYVNRYIDVWIIMYSWSISFTPHSISAAWQIGFIFSFSMIDTIGFIRASNGYFPCHGIENRSRPGTDLMRSVSELLCEYSRNSRYKYVYRYMHIWIAMHSWIICFTWHDDVIRWKHFCAWLALCAGNSPVTGGSPSQRPVARVFDVFLWSAPWINVWVKITRLVIWDAIALINTSL